MSFTSALKSQKLLLWIWGVSGILLIGIFVLWSIVGSVWTQADFQILDLLYRYAAQKGHTSRSSPQIAYLAITNETYEGFGQNSLDRTYLAEVNRVLGEVGARAVAYDIIFTQPSSPEADQQFARSLELLGNVYLPMGFDYSDEPSRFRWGDGVAYERLNAEILQQPRETGHGHPFYATRVLPQWEAFAKVGDHGGHITALPDSDGVYRHQILLLKVEDRYIPTLSLTMFLNDIGVTLNEIFIEWGREIRIPADASHYINQDVIIPINDRGQTFIPFSQPWGQDFKFTTVQDVLQQFADITRQGNVESFFSGKFIFIGDISQGVPDLGQTPIDENVPLIVLHTALLNGLLTRSFYRFWSITPVMLFILVSAGILVLASLPKPVWPLYLTGVLILPGIMVFTWIEFTRFILFPAVMVGSSILVFFAGLMIALQVGLTREKAFIHNAFAHYVPETVIKELLEHPEKLTLGGEKRTISILFSDLQDFSLISEILSPEKLVTLLNEYFTEMTAIILNEGGIVDKYQGDGIMAEFGAPLPLEDHADRAVSAALKMQRRLGELRRIWIRRGLPELFCRIGINTSEMVIGNMGSEQVFNYTVIGDGVNLASRLEGANKLYNTFLMISENTCKALTQSRFRMRLLDLVKVKGKSTPVKIFEVYGDMSDPIEPIEQKYYQNYQAGLTAYFQRDFRAARSHFATALQIRPDDPASKGFISRITAFGSEELSEDWDGSVQLISK